MDESDVMLAAGVSWAILGVLPYLLALDLRVTVEPAPKALYKFTCHVFEWWSVSAGFIIGLVIGVRGKELHLSPVIVCGVVSAATQGGLGYIYARRCGFGADVDGKKVRAVLYVIVAAIVFTGGVIWGQAVNGHGGMKERISPGWATAASLVAAGLFWSGVVEKLPKLVGKLLNPSPPSGAEGVEAKGHEDARDQAGP